MATTDLSKAIRIRMYRVGFGDCFLMTLPIEGTPRHLLIDCGVHMNGDIKTMETVVEQIAKETNETLAVAVATHEHQDHLSGFATYADRFRQFKVGEVWLPWTSNPGDPQAAKLRKKNLNLLGRLKLHFGAAGAKPEVAHVLQNLAPNKDAMELLRSGFGGQTTPRYLEPKTMLDSPAGLKGLKVRVLAPPRDVDLLAKMEPPTNEKFLGLGGATAGAGLRPFEVPWVVPPARYRKAHKGRALSEADKAMLQQEISMEALAFALDSAVNNTSLVLLLSFGGQHLLFPGDAQWGNWSSWIDAADGTDLLGQVSFYKVSHHGSYNATPKSALAAMPAGQFAAMASTQSTPWESIPRKPLMDALAKQTKNAVVRSDSIPIPKAPKGPALPKAPKGFKLGQYWADYVIKL